MGDDEEKVVEEKKVKGKRKKWKRIVQKKQWK